MVSLEPGNVIDGSEKFQRRRNAIQAAKDFHTLYESIDLLLGKEKSDVALLRIQAQRFVNVIEYIQSMGGDITPDMNEKIRRVEEVLRLRFPKGLSS